MNFPVLSYFQKAWPVISKLSSNSIKKKLVFHDICQDLGIELFEDQFDFVYLQSLSIFLLAQKVEDWGAIFELPDVRKAFHIGYPQNNFEETNRLLDHHLHTTIKAGPLKSLNYVPENLLPELAMIFSEQTQANLNPSTMETIRAVKDSKNEILAVQLQTSDQVGAVRDELKSMREAFQQLISPAGGNSFQNQTGYQEIIDKEHQAQLDFIKKLIEQKAILTAQSQLLELKERIGPVASASVMTRLLNNIGYTFIMLDKQDEAIGYYQQALKFPDNDIPPLTNLIGLYFAKKMYNEAKTLVEKVKDSHPGLAIALELYLTNEKAKETEPESLLPEGMETNVEVLVALINIYSKRDLRKALHYARALYEGAPDNENYIDIYCNITLVTLVGEKVDFETRELQSDQDKKILSEVGTLLESLWNKFEPTEYKRHKTQLLERLILLLTVLGEHSKAHKFSEELLAINPQNYNAQKFRAMNLMFEGKYPEAALAFDKITTIDEHIWEFLPAWMISHGKAGRIDEAKAMADRYLQRSDSEPRDLLRAYSILAFILVDHGRFEEALEATEKVLKAFPNNLGALADKARIFRGLNQPEEEQEATSLLEAVVGQGLAGQSIKDIYIAANYFSVIANFQLAADMMASFVDTNNNNDLTLQLADCYSRSGRKGKALLIYENLRRRYGLDKSYTPKEIEIYYFYRDYPKAVEVLEEYIALFPDDWRWWLNLGGLYLKTNNQEGLKRFCKVDFSEYQFSLMELESYIGILHSQGYRDKCLDLVYHYRRVHPSMESNKLYINYCLYDPENKKDTEDFTTAKKNAVVFLLDGSREFHYIIEDLEEELLLKNSGEINLKSKIYKLLKDKPVGAKISFGKQNQLSQHWVIKQIIPKYRFAFQEAMRENTTIYADESGIIGGNFHSIKDLEKLIDRQIKKDRDIGQMISEAELQYENYQLPLPVFARYNHKNPIEIYEYFLGKGTGIRFSLGNVQFYNQALRLAGSSKTYVLDITALLSLYRINAKLELAKSYHLVISVYTRELIETYVAEKEKNSYTDQISFFEHNGQKLRMLVKAEDKKVELSRLQGFLEWVNTYTETKPCKFLLDYDNDDAAKFRDLFGTDILESALLSTELKGVYVSDDAANRRFVEEKYLIKSIWTQPLLKTWANAEVISSGQYNELVFQLINLGHQHTTVDSNDILMALTRSDYKVSGPFEAFCKILSGKFSDDQSINIAFAVIAGILQLAISTRNKESLIYFVLLTFISYRCLHPLINRLSLHAPLSVRAVNDFWILQRVIRQLVADIGLESRSELLL